MNQGLSALGDLLWYVYFSIPFQLQEGEREQDLSEYISKHV